MQQQLFDEELTPLEEVLIEQAKSPLVFDRKTLRLQEQINNVQNNMLIHGFLKCIHLYVNDFGLESTAAAVIRESKIFKDDLVRCQLETGRENEKMLQIIDKAYEPPVKEIDTMPGESKEERLRALFYKHFQKRNRSKFFKRVT